MCLLSFLKRKLFATSENILDSIFGIVTLHLNALLVQDDMFPMAFTASGLQ